MWIKKLYATFGKLDNKTLTLSRGLNIVCGKNESGKSTWTSFIRAMLYGISTREKAKTGFIPDKDKFRPWNGSPMYGKAELEKGGRAITIERTSSPRTGIFAKEVAFFDDDGTPCETGEALVGVASGVYERSAFIGQAKLGVDGDAETERRILALSSGGDETVSAGEVIARLQKRRRELRSPRGMGKLTEIENELSALRERTTPETLFPMEQELHRLREDVAKSENAELASRLEMSELARTIERYPAFEGMSDSLAKTSVKRDIEKLKGTGRGKLFFISLLSFIIPALLLALSFTVSSFLLIPGIVTAAISALLFISSVIIGKHRKNKLHRELILKYNTADPEKIIAACNEYCHAFSRLESAEKTAVEQKKFSEQKSDELIRKTEAFTDAKKSESVKINERIKQLTKLHDELSLSYDAIGLAAEVIAESDAYLRNRFSPALQKRTSELFSMLTGGHFDIVNILDSSFEMDVAEGVATAPHGKLTLSQGTLDELYFALRLALGELVLDSAEPPPIILDDALVNFDDERMACALKLLKKLSESRQVILFTCHKRESEYFSDDISVNKMSLY